MWVDSAPLLGLTDFKKPRLNRVKAKANKTGAKYIKLEYQRMKNKVDYKIRELRVNYYTNEMTENEGNLKGT